MFTKSSSNSYNQVQATGFLREYVAAGAGYSPYLAACYSPVSERVYFSPFAKNAILEYDPVTGEQIEYLFNSALAYPGGDSSLFQFSYSIITDHLGNIYAIPYFAPTIIMFNVVSKQFKYVTGLVGGGIGKYYGGCLANDGNVYFFSYANTRVLKYDPVLDIALYFGDTTSLTTHLFGVYGEDNCIYQVPHPGALTTIRKTDLNTGTVTYLPVLPNAIYEGITHTLDGRFCIIPASTANDIILFNPIDESIESFPFTGLGSALGTGLGFRLAPNGNVYGFAGKTLIEIKINESKVNMLDTGRFQASIATQGCTYTPQGIVFYSWASGFVNKILTITNIGKHEDAMTTIPLDISTISTSLWNKFQHSL